MKDQSQSKVRFKIIFYFISLWLLFLLGAISSLTICENGHFIGVENLLKRNIFAIILLLLSIVSLALTKVVDHSTKGTLCPSYEVASVENENYEVMVFIATYIIPLVCMNLAEVKSFVVFSLLVITLGIIATKMDLYMANPALALLGYRLYSIKVNDKSDKSYFVITKKSIKQNDHIEWKELDTDRWYIRRV